MIQRAAASQKRLNEFLKPDLRFKMSWHPVKIDLQGNISFENVDFIYPHTGIQAFKNFNLEIKKGEKIAIVGRTGSGKINHCPIVVRMYDPNQW